MLKFFIFKSISTDSELRFFGNFIFGLHWCPERKTKTGFRHQVRKMQNIKNSYPHFLFSVNAATCGLDTHMLSPLSNPLVCYQWLIHTFILQEPTVTCMRQVQFLSVDFPSHTIRVRLLQVFQEHLLTLAQRLHWL